MSDTSVQRVALEAIRDRFAKEKALSLSDVGFLLDLAVNDYDLSADLIVANLETLLLGSTWEKFLPAHRRVEPRRPKSAPIGPLVRVDSYECSADRLRVEVERSPGADDLQVEAFMEAERGAPQCPECEREMTLVGRKLRKAK